MSNIVAVEVNKTLGSIQDNLDLVETSIKEQIAEYKSYVVTEDNIKDSKHILADIRKAQKALDDDRKTIKKEWNKPYDEFEARAKRIIALYDEPIRIINQQLDEFEEDRKNKKRTSILDIYNGIDKGEYADWLPLDSIFNGQWLNAIYSEKNIRADIEAEFEQLNISISSIKAMESEFEQEGLAVLKKTRDFQRAVQEITRRTKMKEEIIRKEQEKAEAFARDKAEKEARIKVEEKAQNQSAADTRFPDIPPMENDAEREYRVIVHVKENDLNLLVSVLSFNNFKFEVE